jgi:hypothetical protein
VSKEACPPLSRWPAHWANTLRTCVGGERGCRSEVVLRLCAQVPPSPSLPLCLPHRLSHCVSLTVSPTVSPSPSLPLCLPRRRRVSRCCWWAAANPPPPPPHTECAASCRTRTCDRWRVTWSRWRMCADSRVVSTRCNYPCTCSSTTRASLSGGLTPTPLMVRATSVSGATSL